MRASRHREDRGFALLLVFAMAAIVAVMLYAELPRAAFESQRMKEEMLIERGEEYKRAVQLYISSFKKYPQNLDELEKNARYRMLRRRYKDPMTGEDEWRLIHATNGVVTDSKIKKNDKEKKAENTFITEAAAVGSSGNDPNAQGANPALRRRESDDKIPAFPGSGTTANPQANPADPNAPPPPPGQPQQQQQQQQPGAPQQFIPGPQTLPGQVPLGTRLGFPGAQQQPGQQQIPGQQQQQGQQPGQQQNYGQITAGPQIGAMPVTGPQPGQPQQGQQQQQQYPTAGGYPNQPGVQSGRQSGFGGAGFGSGFGQQQGQQQQGPGGQNQAIGMIQRILTTPNPNMNPTQGAPQQGGGVMGSGIVGVASKYERDSIKIYNEQQKYDLWEFIYDPQKDPRNKQQVPGGTNQPNSPPTGGPLPNAMPGQNQGMPLGRPR